MAVSPLKKRNAETVGQALVKFIGEVRDGTVEIAFDNEPVLVAAVSFCKAARAKAGLGTIVSPNKWYDIGRTRFVQTVRGIQKTLIGQIEDHIEAAIPDGHPLIQWAAMHSAWLYDRYHVHATMKVTPYQSLYGRPYRGRLVCFGQTVYGLDPRANKFKPGWRKGAWIDKDSSNMDLIATDGMFIMKTKAVRKVSDDWDADRNDRWPYGLLWTSPNKSKTENCGTLSTDCPGDRRGS